jgi:hypothetical protein
MLAAEGSFHYFYLKINGQDHRSTVLAFAGQND